MYFLYIEGSIRSNEPNRERMFFLRELSIRMLLAFLVCIACGVLFTSIATAISTNTIETFDRSIIDVVQSTETPALTTIMKFFTALGSTSGVLIITVSLFSILYFGIKSRPQAYLFATTIIGTVALNQLLKFIFKRNRPAFHRLVDIGGYSFPSGHTMIAFSLFAMIAFIMWRRVQSYWTRFSIVLFASFMIVIIALSRIYLGVHFPSDIIGGMSVSAIWFLIATTVYTYYQQHATKKIKFALRD